MRYLFDDCAFDTDRRELRRGTRLVSVEPQVFDLIEHLICNRERVVSKDELIASIWGGRIVSESALATRINAARSAIGDSGEAQRLIKTLPRKGIRFVGVVREERPSAEAIATAALTNVERAEDSGQQWLRFGAAVRQHERGSRAGLFRRRHGRRDHHRPLALPLLAGHRAQLELHLQGPQR